MTKHRRFAFLQVAVISLLLPIVLAPGLASAADPTADELRDRKLLDAFPEATQAQTNVQNIDQLMSASDLQPAHIAAFERDFEKYLDIQIGKGVLPASAKAWWIANRGIFLKKAFMNTPGATYETLAVAIGRGNRNLTPAEENNPDRHGFIYRNTLGYLPPGVRSDVQTVWGYVKQYGGWIVGLSWPILHPIVDTLKTAYTTGPLGTLATASVQNWIRGPAEDLQTMSSQLKEKVTLMLSNRKVREKDLKAAKDVVQKVETYTQTLHDAMNQYDFANLTPEQAKKIQATMDKQAKSAFMSLSSSIAPYMREGRANVLDAQFRPMNFANSMGIALSNKMAAQDRVERMKESLHAKGVPSEKTDELISLMTQIFESENYDRPPVKDPKEYRGQLKRQIAELKNSILSVHGVAKPLSDLEENQNIYLLARKQMGTTMAAWWDHDTRFPELNRKMAPELRAMAGHFKEGFGFPDYLRMPGVKSDMLATLGKVFEDLKESREMLESKINAAAHAEGSRAEPSSDCETGYKNIAP